MTERKRHGARGLALNPENLVPGVNAARPGEARGLKHGLRTTRPHNSPEWSPAVGEAIRDLEARVGDELRDEHGELHPWAEPSIEAVALARVVAWRADRYLADRDARGLVKPADLDIAGKAAERFHRALEREAMTLRSRLDAQSQASSVFEQWVQSQSGGAS